MGRGQPGLLLSSGDHAGPVMPDGTGRALRARVSEHRLHLFHVYHFAGGTCGTSGWQYCLSGGLISGSGAQRELGVKTQVQKLSGIACEN